VEVTNAPVAVEPGQGWLEWERTGALTRFIETGFAGEATEDGWRLRFGDATVTAQPMTLREIFLTLTRSAQGEAKEASA
jgi:hypothetical protein